MRSEEYARYSGRTLLTGMEGTPRDTVRDGWDVLRLAARVEVSRLWSEEEVARAGQHGDDPRLAEAVRHAADYGVAEYLAAAPQLLSEWRDAWAPRTHPRAATLVLAASDAPRAGIHRPLPSAILRQMHEPYLQRRGGDRLRSESLDDALAWAMTPLYATSSLLIPDRGGLLAFDCIIDGIGKRPGTAGYSRPFVRHSNQR
jgi:eukaryotic-like serine/threonine-protein kinase